MNYYNFEYPIFLLALPLLLWCLYRCQERLKSRYFVHLHFMQIKKRNIPWELFLKIAVTLSTIFALSSPVIIDTKNPFNRMGKDIVLILDASGSMSASGFDTTNTSQDSQRVSRFELTKRVAKDFLLKRDMDNIGIIVYGDFAFIASPITYEKKVLSQMLDYITQGMAGQNTAIGEALAVGVRAFEHSKAKNKVMILLSDGEHNSGSISPKDAMKLLKDKKIKTYTIFIANQQKDSNPLLGRIAQESGGVFYSVTSLEELKKVYKEIDSLESSKIRSREYKFKEYKYQTFLLFGVLFLLVLMLKRVWR